MKFSATVSKGTVTFGFEAKSREHAALLADKMYAERDFEVFDIAEVIEGSQASIDTEKWESDFGSDI